MEKKNLFVLISLCASFTLLSCGPGQGSGAQPSTSETVEDVFVETDDPSWTSLTTFDEPVDFHTEDQKAFLSYEGNYEDLSSNDIRSNYHVDGNSCKSKPLAVNFAWEYDAADGLDKYALEFSLDWHFENEDEIYTVVGTSKPSLDVYNLQVASHYYYRVRADYSDGSMVYSPVRQFDTTDQAPRNLNIDGMTNCRDMGGRKTVNDGVVKQGLLFRTGAPKDTISNCEITAAGKKTLLGDLKAKTEIELRGGARGNGGESGGYDNASYLGNDLENFQFCPLAYEGGKSLLYRNIEPVRKVFDVLGDADNYPIFYHCRIGTDRTGLFGLLVNGLLGVPEQEIFQDYLFSDFGKIGKTSAIQDPSHPDDNPWKYITDLQAFEGNALQDKIYNFLCTMGVPHDRLDTIIDVMTEGNKPENDPTKVNCVLPDDFEGATVKTSSNDFRQAEKYIDLAKGDEITYTWDADSDYDARLYANLKCSSTSLKTNTAVTITLDGNEVNLKGDTLSSLGFGGDYWIPTQLSDEDVSISAGTHTLTIKAESALSISLASILRIG